LVFLFLLFSSLFLLFFLSFSYVFSFSFVLSLFLFCLCIFSSALFCSLNLLRFFIFLFIYNILTSYPSHTPFFSLSICLSCLTTNDFFSLVQLTVISLLLSLNSNFHLSSTQIDLLKIVLLHLHAALFFHPFSPSIPLSAGLFLLSSFYMSV
jgi:hypothetical protein